MTELPAKVLFVRLGAIGDVANALVVASALKRKDPSVEIGWAVHGLARPLVDGHPAVDRVHLWNRGGGFSELRRFARELRAERYPLAVDLQRTFKSGFVTRLSGAPRRVGFDRARTKEGSWIFTNDRIPPGDRHAHMVRQYLEVARHLGAPADVPIHELPTVPAAAERAEALVAELGAPPILVNLGASKPSNRWVPGRFGELAVRLAETTGRPVCLTGGPADRVLFAPDLAAIAGTPVRDLVGRTKLPELWELQRRSALFVGLDTGPMHLAAAVGLPCVILFGAADPGRTGPFGDHHRIVRFDVPCAPCNKAHCRLPRHECMEGIEVEVVAVQAKILMGAASEAPDSGPPDS